MRTQEQTQAFLSALGRELEYWRKQRNKERDDVAALAGTTAKLIGRYERGEVVKIAELYAIADVLQVNLSDMVRRAEEALEMDTRAEARRRQAG